MRLPRSARNDTSLINILKKYHLINEDKGQETFLFDCDTLCQVSRLVHIGSPFGSDVIGKKLKRKSG